MSCRENGSGLIGNGCSEAATSPGTVLAGTLRYSIGKRGAPSILLNKKRNPCLDVWATAGISLPFRFTVTNVGGDGKSLSHMSWRTPWKCQILLPVAASRAISEFAKRLSPILSPPYQSVAADPVGT